MAFQLWTTFEQRALSPAECVYMSFWVMFVHENVPFVTMLTLRNSPLCRKFVPHLRKILKIHWSQTVQQILHILLFNTLDLTLIYVSLNNKHDIRDNANEKIHLRAKANPPPPHAYHQRLT